MREPYATLDDVYLLGLPAQAFIVLARPFDAVDATSGTIRLKAHGFDPRDTVTLEVTDGGALPSQLSQFVTYSPLPISSDLFKLCASQGSSPIAGLTIGGLSNGGSGWAISLDPIRRIQNILIDEASIIDEHLTAHEPPIVLDENREPHILVGMNARRAARRAINTMQLIQNPAYREATDRLFAFQAEDDEMMKAWKAGKPIQPRPIDQDAEPDNAARAFARPPIPWSSGEL